MSLSMDRKTIHDKWKVKSSSQEYLKLPSETREKIDEYLSEIPVKLGAIAKSFGVKVLLSTLPSGVSGQISYKDEEFVILINRHEAKYRQRFTLAHELAHFLLHQDLIVVNGGWSENVLLRAPNQPISIEYEANRLASDLVIPTDLLLNATKAYTGDITSDTIEDLARRFGVSVSAMEIKLQIL